MQKDVKIGLFGKSVLKEISRKRKTCEFLLREFIHKCELGVYKFASLVLGSGWRQANLGTQKPRKEFVSNEYDSKAKSDSGFSAAAKSGENVSQ